jgi:hypothetical protein
MTGLAEAGKVTVAMADGVLTARRDHPCHTRTVSM